MTKVERKVMEKLAMRSYAKHLYDGVKTYGNYTVAEAKNYWENCKSDPLGVNEKITEIPSMLEACTLLGDDFYVKEIEKL